VYSELHTTSITYGSEKLCWWKNNSLKLAPKNLKITLIKTLYKIFLSVPEVGARDTTNFMLPVSVVRVM
jgi:hypothetical protein